MAANAATCKPLILGESTASIHPDLPSWLAGIAALLVVCAFYWLAARARRQLNESKDSKVPIDEDVQEHLIRWRFSPLVITAGVFGRASLSNLQVFYFTLIVFWVLTFHLLRCGVLSELSSDVLLLLGIGAAGTAGAKITGAIRRRLSFENWAWLKRKGWIKNDIGRKRAQPRWSDLITSEETFDVSKFQTVIVSFAVGVALLAAPLGAEPGAVLNFEIDENLLGLLGLSQTINVGNKAIAPAPNAELNTQLDKVRRLEAAYVAKVIETLSDPSTDASNIKAAKEAASAELEAYREAVRAAAVMVQERTQALEPPTAPDPELPDTAEEDKPDKGTKDGGQGGKAKKDEGK